MTAGSVDNMREHSVLSVTRGGNVRGATASIWLMEASIDAMQQTTAHDS